MQLLTQQGFAVLAGVTNPAVSHAIQTGMLRYTEFGGVRGIDPDDELSLAYLANKNKNLKPRRGRPPRAPSEIVHSTPSQQADTQEEPRRVEYGNIVAQRQRDAELKSKLLELKIDRENRARLLAIRQIVPRSMTQRIWADLGVSLRENIRTVPDRISAQIAAICGHPELEVQVRELLSEEIETSLARMAEATKRAISLMEQEEE